jgi:hypothetical protein
MEAKEIRYYTVATDGDAETEEWDSVVRPVVTSTEFDEDFQCMTGSVFLDLSGRSVLWEMMNGGTKASFGMHRAISNSVLMYQDSGEDSANDPATVFRSFAGNYEILPMTLPPGITRVKVFGDGGDVIVSVDFVADSDCLRYALIVVSDTASPNVPVAVHEVSEHPHSMFDSDVLTSMSAVGIVHSAMVGAYNGMPSDARSGLLLGGGSSECSAQQFF